MISAISADSTSVGSDSFIYGAFFCALVSVCVTLVLLRRLIRYESAFKRITRAIGTPKSASHLEQLRIVESIATVSANSHTLNELMRMCHELLHTRGLEVLLAPDFERDVSAATAIRFTSGKPIGNPACEAPLMLGTRKIGILRLDLKSLTAEQEVLLARIADAISFQLLVQRNARELRSMNEQQLASVREQTNFVASLSHELRGPLGMILNAVELVRDELCGPVTPDQRDTLSLVHGNVKHLLNLVGDVLDYAKTESGVTPPTPEDLPLAQLVTELVATARGQAEQKQQSLSVKEDHLNAAIVALADERHVRQIVLNLLTNAIKYTPNGGKISVVITSTAAQVTIAVIDTGVGIPETEQHKVFTPFARVSTGLREQGTGLGMPLSKLLAEKNGGTLSFTSTVGKGSCFQVSLPRSTTKKAAESESVLETLGGSNQQEDLNGQTLLIASQDKDQLAVLERALAAQKAVVNPLEILEHELPDPESLPTRCTALIIDANVIATAPGRTVGDLSGWVTLAGSMKVPLVVMTGHAFTSNIEAYLKAGVDLCLSKPFKATELAQALRKLAPQMTEFPKSK